MTKEEAFREINETQDDYVNQLIQFMNDPTNQSMKTVNFTSPTGTGKTKMMAKLINRFQDSYFIVTSLSKGQLHLQIQNALTEDCPYGNFDVYGLMDYKINSKLKADEILGRIPTGNPCIWLRDEGHIETNRFEELLMQTCDKVINFSATNKHNDIQCNFAHTMMLRTVNQQTGTPEDAIEKLLHIKQIHQNIAGYNPCAIFRCISPGREIYDRIVKTCKRYGLKYIDISDESFNMAELCQDDNPYDVIINKFKLVEGIDIRRAHVLYMDSQPKNDTTTIQAIGRCRRNALLYRNDIDILAPQNRTLLKATRECYVFYNVKEMSISQDENGELCYAFCPYISCEALKTGVTIEVTDGQLPNGLYITELQGQTGQFEIARDEATGFNVVKPEMDFYKTEVRTPVQYFYIRTYIGSGEAYLKIRLENVLKLPLKAGSIQAGQKYYRIDEREQSIAGFALNNPIPAKFKTNFLKVLDEILGNAPVQVRITHMREFLQSITLSDTLLDDMQKYMVKHPDDYHLICSKASTRSDIDDVLNDTAKEYIRYRCVQMYNKKKAKWNNHDMPLSEYYPIIWKQRQTIETIRDLTISWENTEDLLKIITLCFDERMPQVYVTPKQLFDGFSFPYMRLEMIYGKRTQMRKKDMETYINGIYALRDYLKRLNLIYNHADPNEISVWIHERLNCTYNNILHDTVDIMKIDFTPLYEPVTMQEMEGLKNNEIDTTYRVYSQKLAELLEFRHGTVINDRESAIIGLDKFQLIKPRNQSAQWIESKAVTSKTKNYNKLNVFISRKYAAELQSAAPHFFTGKNTFPLDNNCNSMIGYCVEYYSKYIVYGESYLEKYIQEAERNIKSDKQREIAAVFPEAIVVRACMLKYKDMMARSFGQEVKRLIKTASVSSLLQEKYHDFVSLVVSLGQKTAEFVAKTLYADKPAKNNVDPDLSIEHISALADYITEDAILDVKVTNHIEESYIKQVLAYHYLSTKRSDLRIQRVIVYDATSGKSVTVNITPQNNAHNAYNEWEQQNVIANHTPMTCYNPLHQAKACRPADHLSISETQRMKRLTQRKGNANDYRRLIRAYHEHPLIRNFMAQRYQTDNINTCLRRMSESQQQQLGKELWDVVAQDFMNAKIIPHI